MSLVVLGRVRRCIVACTVALVALGVVQAVDPAPVAAACDGSTLTAAQLNAVFANPGVGGGAGYAGGDYQHVYPLPDGRQLWLFQDVFFSADNDLRDSLTMAAHNAGLVQNGTCWSVVGGPQMNNYIGRAETTPLRRWFWPMDGEIGADGALWVFMVEMRNPNGIGAAWGAAPAGTWVARIDTTSLAVLSFAPARDGSTRLYGWSVTSDEHFTYLYGHCYRQFIHQVDSVGQFDAACMPHTYLARVPKGRFDLMPQYRTALGWSGNAFAATPLMTRGAANPMSVQKFGDLYVNVTKIDDWWGAWVYVDKSPNPWGPWEAAESIFIVNDRKCSQCGIYHAELLPTLTADGKMVLSWSNGAPFHLWQANAFLYRPSFRAVTLPTYRTDASLGDAGMQPRTPVRALDTRQTAQRVRTGTMVKVPLAGKVAAGAVGVVANVTAVNPAYSGFLTAWPCGARMPTASVLNFQGSRNTANAVHTRLGPAQELCIMSSVDSDVLVDVAGSYMPTGAAELHPLPPARLADTGGTRLAANGTLVVPVAGVGGVPASGAQAVTVTVTASTPSGYGYLTVWPCSTQRPTVSTLNFVAGDTISNAATMPLGAAGDLCVFSSVATNVTVDVGAWWGADGLRATLATPQRLYDSRGGTKPAAESTTTVLLTDDLPPGTTAVVANVAAVNPVAAGRLTAFSCGALPVGASVSYALNENRAGLVATGLSVAGGLCLHTSRSSHLLIDVTVSFQ
ncbi:MAG: hypothetical protein Q8M22_15785 [Actinomycetota bacterium]|nr:hypothetical protein [Actinomycetota bacterium]